MTRLSPPGAGWHVEVTLPTGEIVRPSVVGDPSRNPKANDFPSLEIPVRSRDLWRNLDLTKDIPMSVYYDGQPQPIDGLETVQDGEGAAVTLVGRGGAELETRDTRSVNFEAAHTVAETIITDVTSYVANVDRPNTTQQTNEPLRSADTETEWSDQRAKSPDTSPINVGSGLAIGDGEGMTIAQTARVRESNAISDKRVSALVGSDTNASDDDAVDLEASGDYVELDWPLDYTVPSEDIRVAVRFRAPDDPDSDGNFETPDVDYLFNGDQVGGFADGADLTSDGYQWDVTDPNDTTSVADQTSPTFRVEVNGNSSGGTFRVDLISMYDARYHDGSAFDNSVDADDYLSSPALFPIGATKSNFPQVEFENAQSPDAVTGGRAELTIDDTSGIEEIALSNDRGESFNTSGSDTDAFETDFGDVGPSVRMRLTLAGLDTTRSTATPTRGFEPPELDAYDLLADLEDLPLVVDQQFDGDAIDNLRTIAEDLADFIFEFRVARDGTESVEMTVPGQRTTDREDPIASFSVSETDVPRVERVVVKGSSRRVEGEGFTANVGSFVALAESDLQLGRTVVRDPATGETFAEGSDFEVDPGDGRLRALSQGDLVDGETYEADYSYRPSATVTVDSPSATPSTEIINLPGLSSERACEQTAKRILEQVDAPIQEATVTIPSDRTGWEVVSALSPSQLPAGFDELEVNDVETTPGETVLRLASRERVGKVVSRLQSRLESTSRRV